MTRRKPDPVQEMMLSYRAEAAEQERWLADITAALGLPAGATQQERVERARALAAYDAEARAEDAAEDRRENATLDREFLDGDSANEASE